MFLYSLRLTRSAEKQLDRLSQYTFQRIDAAILKLVDNPRPAGCKKLKAQTNVWRIRVGAYRVLYEVDESKREVIVLGVLQRKEAYR